MRAVPNFAVRRRGALFAGVASVLAVLVVTTAGAAGGARAAGPQGTLAFASDRSGTFQIYSIRADGSRLGQLTRGRAADAAPLFSPDGRLIVFDRARKHAASELWVMSADGSGQRRLASSGSAPVWSPDSRRLAYIGSAYSGPLVIAGADGSARLVIRGSNLRPYWSPDGRFIAFSRQVGDRTNLMFIGGDGRALRMIRRNARALGWSPRGEIAFTGKYGSGVGLTSTSGRHARRLLPSNPSALVWSPDGRRLAFVDERGLHVASASGRGVRNLGPKSARLDSPAWSPDSRWIAGLSRFGDAVYPDLRVVAADGSSSRPLTKRVPYPWGSENGPPSWRPHGATPARLGGAPVAPLPPSETVSKSTFQVRAPYTIGELAADGGRAALIVRRDYCSSVEVWEPARARVVRPIGPCGEGVDATGNQVLRGVALAGTRVAWLHPYGANYYYTDVSTATLDHPTPVLLDNESALGGLGPIASAPVGHGGLLTFTVSYLCDESASGGSDCPPGHKTGDVVTATIWRFGGRTRCGSGTPSEPGGGPRLCTAVAQADGELRVLAVDAGRIAARRDDGVRLLNAAGGVLRDFPVPATAAALSGNRLALRTADAVEIYDTGSGQRTERFPARKAVSLQDLEGDILVTASGKTVTLRRLGDGRTATLRTDGPAKGKLEQPGLFLAGAHRVTFTPMHTVLRRLGG